MKASIVFALSLCLLACQGQPKYRPPAPIPPGWEAGDPCRELRVVTRVRPVFPRAAAAYDQEGWVAMKYHVAPNGVPFNIRVVKSSPEGVFEQASVAAITRWRYAPIEYPVRNCAHLDIFQLE
jgi:TonB family protein